MHIDCYYFLISHKRKQSLHCLSTSTRRAVYTGAKCEFGHSRVPLVGRWVLPPTPAKDSAHLHLSIGPREILTKLHSRACVKALTMTLPGVPGCRGDIGPSTRKLCGQKRVEFHYGAQQLDKQTVKNMHQQS